MKFEKPPLSFQQQIVKMKERGLSFDNEPKAMGILKAVNYYRLSAYRYPFFDIESQSFHEGTKFEDLWNLYLFDKKLRLLLLDWIEKIEVAIRTAWAYNLAMKHGAHAYLMEDIFYNERGTYDWLMQAVEKEYGRSNERFIQHYKDKYTEPDLPPIWVICEILSFGDLSKFYRSIRERKLRSAISSQFALDEKILSSFTWQISTLRNACAHHSRVWNRQFVHEMVIPRRIDAAFSKAFINDSRKRKKIYNTLVLMMFLSRQIKPFHDWKADFLKLLGDHPFVDPLDMGFPANWKELSVWK